MRRDPSPRSVERVRPRLAGDRRKRALRRARLSPGLQHRMTQHVAHGAAVLSARSSFSITAGRRR